LEDAGRVEIFQDGEWQKLTLALKDGLAKVAKVAKVVCRTLGFPGASRLPRDVPAKKVHSLQVRVHVHRKGEEHFRLRKERGKRMYWVAVYCRV